MAYWADTAPLKGPQLALFVDSGTTEEKRHSQVWCARLADPLTLSRTADANLVWYVATHLFFYKTKYRSARAPLGPSLRPPAWDVVGVIFSRRDPALLENYFSGVEVRRKFSIEVSCALCSQTIILKNSHSTAPCTTWHIERVATKFW